MPEALAIVAVFAVAVAAWIGALVQARDPAHRNPAVELARLREQELDLTERLNLARKERWSGEMIESLSNQLTRVSSDIRGRTSAGGAEMGNRA